MFSKTHPFCQQPRLLQIFEIARCLCERVQRPWAMSGALFHTMRDLRSLGVWVCSKVFMHGAELGAEGLCMPALIQLNPDMKFCRCSSVTFAARQQMLLLEVLSHHEGPCIIHVHASIEFGTGGLILHALESAPHSLPTDARGMSDQQPQGQQFQHPLCVHTAVNVKATYLMHHAAFSRAYEPALHFSMMYCRHKLHLKSSPP